MNKINLSDIKPLCSEYIKHGYKIECLFGTFTLYPITDITIAIYSNGKFTKNVGELNFSDFIGKDFQPISKKVNMCCNTKEFEKVILKVIAIPLENNKVLILNKKDRTIQQIISLNEISETLNHIYSKMDKSFKLDPCTSKGHYNTMLGYKFIDISDRSLEVPGQPKVLKSFEKKKDSVPYTKLKSWSNG